MTAIRSSVMSIGENRGLPRLYLNGKWMARSGFLPNVKYSVQVSPGKVELRATHDGDRGVCAKKDGTPVIDLTGARLAQALGAGKVEVSAYENTITITKAQTVILIADRKLVMTEGSLFSGGGLLTEAAKELGFEPRFAVEFEQSYADIFERNHPSAELFNCSVEEVSSDRLRAHRPLGLLTMGIPCEPYSNIRRLDRGGQTRRDATLPPEAHENGDMVYWGLRAVEASNPHTVLVENVPAFMKSGAYHILTSALRRFGYFVDARIVDPADYGELTGRKRAIIIANAQPIKWPEPLAVERRLGEILDPEPHEWFDRESKSWLYKHWDSQTAKGNGFAAQQVDANSTRVGTIKKRYFAGQGDNPVVKHPSKPNTHRWLTLNEVRRLQGVPAGYYLGSSKTTAGEVIGQAVEVSTMRRIISSVTGILQARLAAA